MNKQTPESKDIYRVINIHLLFLILPYQSLSYGSITFLGSVFKITTIGAAAEINKIANDTR